MANETDGLKCQLLIPLNKYFVEEAPNREMDLTTKIVDLRLNLIKIIFIKCVEGRERNIPVTAFRDLCKEIVLLKWKENLLPVVFRCLDFAHLLHKNEEAFADVMSLQKMQEAIAMLFRYGINLLRPKTSPNWRVISFDNAVYVTIVSNLEGHKTILRKYGYTKEMPYGLSYPDASHGPNTDTVKDIAADLAIAFHLIEFYINDPQQHHARIHRILKSKNTDHKEQVPNNSATDSLYSSSSKEMPVNEGKLVPIAGQIHRAIDSGIVGDDLASATVKDSFMNESSRLFGRTKSIDSDKTRIMKENQFTRSPSSPKRIQGVREQSSGLRDFDDILKDIAKAISDHNYFDSLGLALGISTHQQNVSFEGTLTMLRDWRKRQIRDKEREALREALLKAGLGHLSKDLLSNGETVVRGDINLRTCGICKQKLANIGCDICSQPRCESCDELWHKHPQRQGHTRHPIIPEEPEAPGVLQPVADISQRHIAGALPRPVINNASINETHLLAGRPARTSDLSTLPEVSLCKEMSVSHSPDLPQPQPDFELMAEVNCDFCIIKPGRKFCSSCGETYCLECDSKRHSNQRRKDHKRQDVTQTTRPGNLSKNQELDSIVSTYFSVPGVPVDSSYINSEEDLDVRAPPNDRYRVPMERASVSPAAPTTEKHKSPALEESPYMYVTPLKGGGMAPQHRSGVGTLRQMELQAELNRITAEDIVTLEKLFSVRSLREQESDSDKIAVLMQEEQKLTQMHEEFQKKLKVLQTHISGISGESRHGAAGAGPQDISVGAAIAAGAGAGIPQGKSLPPVTSAENMSAATNSPEIRQQILDPAKTSRQEPKDTQQSAQEEGWTCQHCTFLNTNMESNICSVCDKTSFPKAKIQPIVRPKETKAQPSNSASEVQMKPTTKEERRKKNAEYYQQLEAEMLAEKQHAKDEYSRHSGSPQVDPTIIAPKKALEKSKPLSDTDLLELAQLIPHGRCIKLGIELGFSHHELNKLQVRDPMGISGGGIFEMLRMWKGDVRGHEQRPKLKQILANAGLLGLTHVLEENRFTQDEPSVSSPKAKTIRNSTALPSRMSTSSGKTAPDEVSEGELLQLSRMIPVDSIHELGFNLQFSYSKVQDFLHRHRMNFQVTILHMLHEWKNRTRHSDQRRELNNILIDSNLGGLTLAEVVSKPKVESREPRGITDIELYELADSLNAENITQLGLYLGFGMAAISRYQHEAALESPREGTRRMLLDWKNHEPETDQRECLSNVLDQIGCMHLGEKIRNYLGFTKHHDTFGESLQQQLSHATSFGDLSYVKDEEKMKYEEMRTASLERIAELREAESQGIPTERIKCALYIMEEYGADLTDPIEWIAVNWSDVISELAHKATQELRENLEVDVDPKIMELVQVSAESAEKCLQDCSGNIEEAVKECTQRTQEKILEIQEFDCFSVDDTVAVLKLDDVQGDAEKALDALQGKAMAEYVDRVWTSTNDDDNEYFQEAIRNDDRSIRMLMVEYSMRSWGRAQTAAKLIVRSEFPVDDVVIAAEECGDLRRSEVFLKQQCSVCFIDLPRNKLMSLINCQCMMCRECVIEHFEVIARDKSIMKGTCPACDMPNLDDQAVAADYFAFLDILLRDMLTPEVYELFQRKLRDWNLMQDENFCWCAHCNSGFINGAPDRRKMRCPECNKLTCFNCKKQWMDQHEGISCEAFQEWKENNDPDLQAQGLAAHLNENGIDCPRCKMRYELAKGGCMHFKCPQCTFEFCCGCNEPIKKDCDKFASCPKKGLHAHHPRDCLFYLRDEEIAFLKKLLDDAKVEYNKVPPEGAEENEEGECGVKEQKDGPNGLEDNKCGRKVTPGNAGLCRIHYIEYLVGLINGKNIDPAKSFRVNQLEAILNREDIPVPARRPAEADPDYRKRLLNEVQTKLPLKKSTRGRAR